MSDEHRVLDGCSVGIVGLGVMGGSLALAVRQAGATHVRGYALETRDALQAHRAGAIDEIAATTRATALDVDWCLLATPLSALSGLLEEIPEGTPRIMDVASLQAPPLEWAAREGLASRLVTAHPMVGSEASGFGAARDDLFVGGRVWLSAGSEADDGVRLEAEAFWTALAAGPEWIDPWEHDRRMVGASHLPQVVANALAAAMAKRGLSPDDLGPGGLDMTRLAASSPRMWTDLMSMSGPALASALRGVAGQIEALAGLLDEGDLDEVGRRMDETRRWRQTR